MPKVNTSQKRILLCPLDWGLGHTTRCIPVISSLIKGGAEVTVACSASSAIVLQEQFSDTISYINLPGYGIRYGKRQAIFTLMAQLPKIARAINMEHQWLLSNAEKIRPDAIISDNRYGCYHPSIPSFIITHQVQLHLRGVLGAGATFVNKKLGRMLDNFKGIWVPDIEDAEASLGGKLSHPATLPKAPINYIGHLSHLPKIDKSAISYQVAAILSGPEPLRTILEHKILEQAKNFKGKIALVRGLAQADPIIDLPSNMHCVNYASSNTIAELLASSEYIVCRSGYSSLMDYLPQNCKCLLIPTPGQPEQQYLAERLEGRGIALKFIQKDFDLTKAMTMAQHAAFKPIDLPSPNTLMDLHISKWLNTLE